MNALTVAAIAVIALVLFLIVGRSFFGLQSRQDNREVRTESMQKSLNDETADRAEDSGDNPGRYSGQPPFVPDEASKVAAPETSCPVRMPRDCVRIEYRQGKSVESWHGYSTSDCRSVAREMLMGLEEDGFELVKAGFLDLSGDAWGCTVKTPGNGSLVISLIPERLGESSGKNNRLSITIVHMKALEIEQLEGIPEEVCMEGALP